ncbi:hypothetical protein MPL1032_180217 [Mesorhizobium plurifarium]|uniref:Uncharacterized protein n=1 Tax=Mesorhizobium plurifarium TaxID=69974 RepID=A0A0K2VTY2_MESPL|nr:hypothetical protein MPL1032_180217 [Mesorhizobium plurifarium]
MVTRPICGDRIPHPRIPLQNNCWHKFSLEHLTAALPGTLPVSMLFASDGPGKKPGTAVK